MTPTEPRMYERTHGEAVLDVRYGMRYNLLCERFYNRVDFLLGFVTLTGSSAAAVSFFNRSPDVALVAGGILAVASVFGRLVSAGRKAEQHAIAKRAYAALDARSSGLTVEEVDKELRPLQASSPAGIELLAGPAFNANLRSAGRTDFQVPLGRAERLASLLA